MADMLGLGNDIGGYSESTTTPGPALFGDTTKGEPAVQGAADTPNTGITWADIVKLAQQGGIQKGGQTSQPNMSTFGGYKQNVPVSTVQPVLDTDKKKNDQGIEQG